jgi:ABC-type phosphate/phosphonate transport system substrate-binding protein
LVRKDSEINSITQLKGKKLVTSKWTTGDLGGLYLETILLENKLPVTKQFFSEILQTETSNRAIVDLLFKKADVALVNENQFNIAAELNPQLRSNLKILSESEPYLIFVTALSKNTPTQEVKAIKNSLLTVHKTAKGRSVLNLLKIQGFQEISLADIDNVRLLIAKNNRLKAEQHVH